MSTAVDYLEAERARARMAMQAAAARLGVSVQGRSGWPETYVNSETGKQYEPHHEDECGFVESDSPRYCLAKGGEGGGKSVAGIVKNLERLRRGMSGIMGSSDLQHFKKSLWPEFRRWCPPQAVIESQRYRLRSSWEPSQMFTLTTISGAQLICGGFDDPSGWEGPNVSFAHWDEARRHKTAAMLKVLDGRVRIPGPNGEPPQLYLTTTPRKHWLFDYFGPETEDDPFSSFKSNALVITLLTVDNEPNLSPGFAEQRAQTLTEAEKRVLLLAQWEDIDDVERFLPSITLWDACQVVLPALDRRTPLILAADAAVSGDTFGLIGISRHPSIQGAVAVREVRAWEPKKGEQLNFQDIEEEIKDFCQSFNVLLIAYDPYQLHQMMTGLRTSSKMRNGSDFPGVRTVEVKQGAERLIADKQLLDLILNKRVFHGDDKLLRQHLDNADRKLDQDRKLRIVKREDKLKIDLAVALSMACYKESVLPDFEPPVSRSFSGVGSR